MNIANRFGNPKHFHNKKFIKDIFGPMVDQDGNLYVFFMERNYPNPIEYVNYHTRSRTPASVGCAVSRDLLSFEYKGRVLEPGGEWSQARFHDHKNDFSLATGDVLKDPKSGVYWMFYTQRPPNHKNFISCATSNDLITWQKNPHNPILKADNKYYHLGEAEKNITPEKVDYWHAFRDPAIFQDKDEQMYMIFTARQKSNQQGCVGLAKRNGGMDEWQLMPPLFSSQLVKSPEVAQIINLGDRWYVFFFTAREDTSHGQEGLYCYVSKNGLRGDYQPINNQQGLVMDARAMLDYLGYTICGPQIFKTPSDRQGEYTCLGWAKYDRSFKPNNILYGFAPMFKIVTDGDRIVIEYT